MTRKTDLTLKIKTKKARIGVIGLGYVGLPLVSEFLKKGFRVVGFDIDPEKIAALQNGQSYIHHVDASKMKHSIDSAHFLPTVDFSVAKDCDALILCVPTPLTEHRDPDMTYIVKTGQSLSPFLRAGQLISLESTTYPGTTRDVLISALTESNSLEAGKDFFVAYSPEREDPNNPDFSTSRIPKVVGGINQDSLDAAIALYSTIIEKLVPVTTCEVAEATKLLENIFRSVNIALVNELKVLFDRMGIDIWEVIEAAKTKPFGFMPFYPGPGLGGHCIPIDPFYLTWKAREFEFSTRFIELAGEINTFMPEFVVSKIADALNDDSKSIRNSKILLVGLAYKPNVDDMRESPTLKILKLLDEKGALTSYHDTHIPAIKPSREYSQFSGKASAELNNLEQYDAVVIITAHDDLDRQKIADQAKLVIDTRNAMSAITHSNARIKKA